MRIRTLGTFLVGSLLVVSSFGFSPFSTDEPARVEIVVERVERVSHDEVHFWLKVSNKSEGPVFLAGINYESGPRPLLLFIEQWRTKEGWKRSYCMDTPPPDVIELNPAEAMTFDLVLELPMSVVCGNRITQLEGKFRFQLEYFESEKQVRTYVKKLFSQRWREARAPVALSEPFEDRKSVV